MYNSAIFLKNKIFGTLFAPLSYYIRKKFKTGKRCMKTAEIIGKFFRDVVEKLEPTARKDFENIISGKNPLLLENFLEEHDVKYFMRDVNGNTMLHLLMASTFPKSIGSLLERGVDIHARNDFGDTPFHSGCRTHCTYNLKALLALGVDINARNNDGDTPLHIATSYGADLVVSFLLENGVDSSLRNNSGKTAFDCALEREYFEIAGQLHRQSA
jgi:ankyrin repeat protein